MKKPKNICTRCVMDSSAIDICFDEQGICNYCTEFLERSASILKKGLPERESDLDALVKGIKLKGANNNYDCIIGVSGGVDSSWTLVKAIEAGLRPLAVHMDNGWNSELAQNNIENLIKILGVDLHTHVIDWSEYKQLMQSFFDADVVDIELLYDNAMLAVNYNLAAKHNIKYILAGTNQATEGMNMPKNWNWFKFDKKQIQGIAKRNNVALKTFPSIGLISYAYHRFVKKTQWISFLDNFEYNKNEALDILEGDYNYKPYPYKHYESIFTRFYQGYILPEKFNIDKRKIHFSTLIVTNKMLRETALKDLNSIPYGSKKNLEEDTSYFLKKMGWEPEELSSYLSRNEISHTEYPSEKKTWASASHFVSKIKSLIK